jgi:hypothetical protein
MMFCGKPNLYLSCFHLDQENATGNRSSVRDASANSNRGFSVNFAPLVTSGRILHENSDAIAEPPQQSSSRPNDIKRFHPTVGRAVC